MSVNIERFLAEQIREQRKASSGAFHRRGKGVKHGMRSALLTPYYYMKTKERKKLNGEVVVTNMYETVIHKDEFLLKPVDLQKTMLTRWREIYSNGIIKDQMGMYNKEYYDLVDRLGVPKKERVDNPSSKRGKRKAAIQKQKPIPQDLGEMALQVQQAITTPPAPEIKPILITKGLHLEYNGEYTSEEMTKIFTKLQILTEGELNKFNLSISLTERV